MTVRSFMLVTGQELIASLEKTTGTGYTVKQPLVLHMMRAADGSVNVGFAQWSMIHDTSEIHLKESALLADPIPVIAEVEASYMSNVTGILVAPESTGRILMG